MNKENIQDKEGGAFRDAIREGFKNMGQIDKTTRHQTEYNGEQTNTKGDNWHQRTTESRGEKAASNGEQYAMGHGNQQGYDDDIN